MWGVGFRVWGVGFRVYGRERRDRRGSVGREGKRLSPPLQLHTNGRDSYCRREPVRCSTKNAKFVPKMDRTLGINTHEFDVSQSWESRDRLGGVG